jgi:hypothetical protein
MASQPKSASAGERGPAKSPEERRQLTRGLIENAVMRLTALVDAETAALRTHQPMDLKASNDSKSLGFVELGRVLKLLDGIQPDPSTVKLLEQLNRTLDDNRLALKLQMEAVREVAAIISESIREADSDGTYTLAFRSKGQTR